MGVALYWTLAFFNFDEGFPALRSFSQWWVIYFLVITYGKVLNSSIWNTIDLCVGMAYGGTTESKIS